MIILQASHIHWAGVQTSTLVRSLIYIVTAVLVETFWNRWQHTNTFCLNNWQHPATYLSSGWISALERRNKQLYCFPSCQIVLHDRHDRHLAWYTAAAVQSVSSANCQSPVLMFSCYNPVATYHLLTVIVCEYSMYYITASLM